MTLIRFFVRFLQFINVKSTNADEAKNRHEDPSLEYKFSSDFSHYSTILYAEGTYATDFSSTGKVSGIPVIFVPGNAGSSRQVRSLGSLLQNKTESRKTPFLFNVFAVDFNEELSGIAGMYLERQIRYLKEVTDHVWQMYNPPPKGLILVGHSMGGIVIRSLLRHADFDTSRIVLVLTLGTPHRSPPVNFDSFLENAYREMHQAWQKKGTRIPLISISGGLKDTLVPEHLSSEVGLEHFSATSIDGVEAEADHLCIVWCNQLVRHTSRLLFEYAESPEKFLENIRDVVQRHYASNGNVYKGSVQVEKEKKILLIGNELTTMKNNKNISQEILLTITDDNGLFLLYNKGASWFFKNGKQQFVHNLKKSQYVYVPPKETADELTLILSKRHTLKAVAITQKELREQSLKIGACAVGRSFLSYLWKVENISGKHLALVIPVEINYVWIALRAELKQTKCDGKKKGSARIEFTSRGLRRLSDDSSTSEIVVGFILHSNETSAQILFIMDTNCNYKAKIAIDLKSTVTLVLQRHASILAFCFVVYTLCALTTQMLFCSDALTTNVLKIDTPITLFYLLTNISYLGFIISTKKTDWLFVALSAVVFSLLLHTLLTLIGLIKTLTATFIKASVIQSMNNSAKILIHLFMSTGMLLAYSNNGFFSIASFLIDFHKRVAVSTTVEDCTLNALITLLHLISVILFLPHGICSIWNLKHYALVAVYEDPTYLTTYVLAAILFLRIYTNCRFTKLVSLNCSGVIITSKCRSY